jgi:hypothetical protein
MAVSTIDSSSLNATSDLVINGVTVGKGGGSVSTNTVVGASALANNTSGDRSVAVGYQAATANTTGINTVIGYQAMKTNTTGTENTAVGFLNLQANTSGGYNASFGDQTLYANTTGSNNVGIGFQALVSNTTASQNTAVGYQAGYTNSTNQYGTFIGYQAGYSSTGDYNTFVGYKAGYSTTGEQNTFLGKFAGNAITTGTLNTIIGAYNGNQGGLDIRTASNYIVLSDGGGTPRNFINATGTAKWSSTGNWRTVTGSLYEMNVSNANEIILELTNESATNPYGLRTRFSNAAPNNASQYFFAAVDSSTSCYIIYSNGTTAGRSDARLKKNIVDATPKLEDICKLKVRNYEWVTSENGSKEIGLIAQEVEEVFPNLVTTNDVGKEGDDYKHVKYSVFVPMLLKAVQELKTIVDAQAAEIAELKAKVA